MLILPYFENEKKVVRFNQFKKPSFILRDTCMCARILQKINITCRLNNKKTGKRFFSCKFEF